MTIWQIIFGARLFFFVGDASVSDVNKISGFWSAKRIHNSSVIGHKDVRKDWDISRSICNFHGEKNQLNRIVPVGTETFKTLAIDYSLTLEKIKGGIDQRKNSLKHFKENVFLTTSFFDNFFFLQVFDNFFSFFLCFGFRSSSAMTWKNNTCKFGQLD